jgi:hypothetical protein
MLSDVCTYLYVCATKVLNYVLPSDLFDVYICVYVYNVHTCVCVSDVLATLRCLPE